MQIGAQLYTVRDYCKDLENFSETLKKVADIGYKTVQVSGVCEFEPMWLKEELAKNDLKCVLTHVRPPETFYEATQKVIADHKVFDCKYLGLGSFGFQEENAKERYEEFVKTYKPVTKAIKEAGQYFMYHNHHNEFIKIGDKNIIEKMCEDFSADELGFTLDVCWVQTAGADPAQWLEKLKGRIPCVHIKDRDFKGNFMPVGEGNLNTPRILKAAANSSVDYLLVEQDLSYDENPFDCLKRSYDYLTAQGLK